MVNNAGVYDSNIMFGSYNVSTDMKVIETNLMGTILGTSLALEKMSLQSGGGGGGGGLVVQICSVAALMTTGASSVYQASKYGVLGYVRSHGPEAQRTTGVRMVAVCPGMTDTQLVRKVTHDWEGELKFNENTRALQPQEVPTAH